jgi:DNA-binding CsgD family transcriptional regulator
VGCVKRPEAKQGEPLTWREAIVRDMILTGMSRTRIAQILGLRGSTLHKHCRRVLLKYGARNDVDLVRIVLTGRLALKVMPRHAA